jgi:hypothetical protein
LETLLLRTGIRENKRDPVFRGYSKPSRGGELIFSFAWAMLFRSGCMYALRGDGCVCSLNLIEEVCALNRWMTSSWVRRFEFRSPKVVVLSRKPSSWTLSFLSFFLSFFQFACYNIKQLGFWVAPMY